MTLYKAVDEFGTLIPFTNAATAEACIKRAERGGVRPRTLLKLYNGKVVTRQKLTKRGKLRTPG